MINLFPFFSTQKMLKSFNARVMLAPPVEDKTDYRPYTDRKFAAMSQPLLSQSQLTADRVLIRDRTVHFLLAHGSVKLLEAAWLMINIIPYYYLFCENVVYSQQANDCCRLNYDLTWSSVK